MVYIVVLYFYFDANLNYDYREWASCIASARPSAIGCDLPCAGILMLGDFPKKSRKIFSTISKRKP